MKRVLFVTVLLSILLPAADVMAADGQVEKLPADLPYVIRKTCQTSEKLLLLLQEKAALMRKYIRKEFAWTGSGASEGIG